MKKLFQSGKKAFDNATQKLSRELESGFNVVSEVVNGLPILVSFERLKKQTQKFDEKHYFVIPMQNCDTKFSLHTMRVLPENVPEINKLPKRRVFHFPNEHYEEILRVYMLETAKDIAMSKVDENRSSLENLADSIDSLDNKLTYGMLFIGAIAAIFNPIIGAGIAVKAVLPSISGLMTKHGLRPLGERFTRSQLEKQAKEAEVSVIKQFSESSTLKVVNPILQQLDYALKTDEWEYDPLVDPNLFYGDIPELEAGAWPHLTEVAIYHVYKDIVEDQNQHEIYNLGPEDIRWLKLMFVGSDESRK